MGLLFRGKLLWRLRRGSLRGVLHRLLLPALTLTGNLLVCNIVDYSRRRVYVVLFLHVIVLWAVGNGSDNAGNGDIHCPQQRQNRENHAENKSQRIATEPAQQHGCTAAENTAGASRNAAGVQVGDQGKALGHLLLLHGKMVNAPAQKYEDQRTDAAHGRGVFPSKCVNDEQVQQSRNGKIEPGLPHQSQHHGLNDFQQCAVRIHADDDKQRKQQNADRRNEKMRRNGRFIFRFVLGIFGRRTLFPGRFGSGTGCRFLLRARNRLLGSTGRFLLSHNFLPLKPSDSE